MQDHQPAEGGDPPFRRIVENGADGVVVLDPEGAIVYANPAAAALLGRPIESLKGRPLGLPVFAGQSAEIDVPGPGDTPRVVELRPIRADWSGRPALLVGLRDVTAYRKLADGQRFLARAGAELARSLDLPETLDRIARLALEHLADGCLIDLVRPDGKICRERARHDSPDLDAAMAPLRDGDCVPSGGPSGLPRVLRTGRPKLFNRATFPAIDSLTGSPARREVVRALGVNSLLILPLVARGRTLGALTLLATRPGRCFSAADLPATTELAQLAALALDDARLYEEACEAVRRRDEFLAMLSHELRNPLASIVHASALLRDASALGAGQRQAVEVVAKQSEQMSRLLDDLLDVSRVTRGIIRVDRRRADLLDVVDRALQAARPAIESAGHRLHFDRPSGPIPIDGDPARLSQVLVNLLTNAARYTPPGGNVWLEVDAGGGQAQVVVRDDGLGIEPELLPRIFDPFIQGRRDLDRSQGGLGIGLTLVKTIVDLHGGAISASSPGPGRGSSFRLRLRTAPPSPDGDGVPASGAPPGGPIPEAGRPLRILIVEDHEDNREMLRTLLEMSGHRVETAADGIEALDALRRKPDLALLDVGLPGMDGMTLARAVRADPDLCGLRMVAITGYARPEDREEALSAGFDAHLPKPVPIEELDRLIALLPDGHPRLPPPSP
ncbi:PAS domain-containing hybrid sensor histidine kinase/response regulator [Tautonia plasticadhaerens]|uniref:histidine kinase n=1 Tax=Tautonia plasticadhaerens TaxID=2527974 RepID=A0A518HCD0_9BACT|nr:ATP-binding protein [Tautonia plasticadhaerens]QDV38525.1 Autoinducer 2 sensor kinase/phosphatase LuxQ [Tautonia plasticadhaerens]